MRFALVALAVLLPVVFVPASFARAQAADSGTLSEPSHASAEWANIALHLPDTATGSAVQLENAADVLRARRYPQDAVRFYGAALARGGQPSVLLKKSGVACLEMQQIGMARSYFQQAVRVGKKDAGAWNNLGAAEFIMHNTHAAIHDYKQAVKLDGESAVYHGNLALAYFENRQGTNARRELARGLAIDPDLLHRNGAGGFTAQVLASERYSEICFEMARIYASQGNMDAVLDWLTKASDRGYNVRSALDHDPTLRPLLADSRIQVLLKNNQTLQAKAKVPIDVPSLGAASDQSPR